MINFFRKTRKQLADDNKPLKYLRYAIGEIILVVVGILIALQINNWNEHQKDSRELAHILNTVNSNLKMDIFNINKELQEGYNLMNYWESLLSDTDNEKLTILYVKNITLRFIPMDNSGFMSVLSNNSFDLISSEILKSNLSSYYGIDFKNKERFTLYLSDLAKDLTLLAIEESIKVKSENTFSKRMSLVLKDPAFFEMTSSYMRLYKIVLTELEKRKTETQNLIELIQKELKIK